MKILFATHDLSYADHISIAYLSAVAKQLKHETYFCTIEKEKFSPNDLISMVKQVKPDIVAYSVNLVGFEKAVETNRAAKNIHDFISIMGGPHTTFSPETYADSGLDVYCLGEGEDPFREFLLKVEQNESYDDIANLITKNKSNPVRRLIDDLDDIPMPDRDLVLSNSLLNNIPKKTFYATRGCPFNCTYCCNNYYRQLYKGKGKYVRRFSVERLIREIEDVQKKYRMDFLKFGDDCFALKADAWLEEFSEKYKKRVNVPFNCYLRLDTIDDKLLKLLKHAGCYSVHLSVDSTSKHVREVVLGRKMRDDNLTDRIKLVDDYGINTWVNYMLACPDSTLQDDLDTIKMSREANVTYPAYSTAVPMKGTALHKYCVERGILDPEFDEDMTGTWEKSVLSGFSEKEKNIRLNVYLLGSLLAKLPYPLYKTGEFLIKHTPPNRLYRKIHDAFYIYSIENKIFKL
ncbi:B12-binding domain-containing radical SAM protein [Candidatus Latescibacterota bacterium]